jgi:hypothetical protein
MVMAMMTAARSQPAAIHAPPNRIHATLSNNESTDTTVLRQLERLTPAVM